MTTTATAKAPKLEKVIADRARRGIESSTPERVRQSGAGIDIAEGSGAQRVKDWPLERLYLGGLLSHSEEIARERYEAGERLYAHWYYAGLAPHVAAIDLRSASMGEGSVNGGGMEPSERQEEHRRQWRKAAGALGQDRVSQVTRLIILDELEPVKVGQAIFARKHEQQCRALAHEYLIDGLDRLRSHWRR